MPIDLRSLRFRQEREAVWAQLENLVQRAEKNSPRALTDEELIALPALYRATLSSLSVARATSLDAALIAYLEALSTRAYFLVYGSRTTLTERLASFFFHDWPAAVSRMWRETLASAALTLLAIVTAYALVNANPDWYASFVPPQMAQGRDMTATADALRDTIYADEAHQRSGLAVFAAFLFTHNAQIALLAFALGFAFCAPTAVLLVYNGLTLGAMIALFARHDLGFEFGGWIAVHGVTEIFAIILSGAAGFRIGLAAAFPGSATRLAAAATAGRQAGVVIAGVVVMLACAGLLEGFARQLVRTDLWRYAIATTSAIVWCFYFYILPRLRSAP